MKNTILLLLAIITLSACKQDKKNAADSNTINTTQTEVNEIPEASTIENRLPDPTENKEFNPKTIVYDTLVLPVVSQDIGIAIVGVGEFHGEEVPSNVETLNWYGLFQEDGKSFLKKVNVKTKRVFDAIIDDEGEKTGCQISVENKENCIVLISGIKLNEGHIPSYSVENKPPIPGDTLTFNSPIPTTLYATGLKNKVSEEWHEIANLKLMISAQINGTIRTQNIIANGRFIDRIPTILWVGDLDGDEQLDFLIDTSNHYNVSSPSLFLSSKAAPGTLLKCVAEHETTGC